MEVSIYHQFAISLMGAVTATSTDSYFDSFSQLFSSRCYHRSPVVTQGTNSNNAPFWGVELLFQFFRKTIVVLCCIRRGTSSTACRHGASGDSPRHGSWRGERRLGS
jgi:hypothetical protein